MALKVSRILHAGYLFECESTHIVFDPIFENPFSQNCYAYPNVQFDLDKIDSLNLDAIFISHYHDDHCSFESLNYLKRDIPIYMFSVHKEIFALLREIGFKNIYSLELNKTVTIGKFKITTRPALDKDVDSIFHIEANGINILNVVDSWIDWDTLKVLAKTKWDMILWPFQTMREIDVLCPEMAEPASRELPPEWIEQLKTLNPRYIVPSSCQFIQEEWSWYRQAYFPISYRQFEKEMKLTLPNSKVIRMNPGTAVLLANNSIEPTKNLDWITAVGFQDVDYDFSENIKIPTTKEIAQNFPSITEEQAERVYKYCQSIKPETSWKLSVYNHQGEVKDFYYPNQNAKIHWFTEVILTKLYAALELGESLSSMYLRIKTAEIEAVDIMDDPLIHCLFNDNRFGYQKAQLKKLR